MESLLPIQWISEWNGCFRVYWLIRMTVMQAMWWKKISAMLAAKLSIAIPSLHTNQWVFPQLVLLIVLVYLAVHLQCIIREQFLWKFSLLNTAFGGNSLQRGFSNAEIQSLTLLCVTMYYIVNTMLDYNVLIIGAIVIVESKFGWCWAKYWTD